MRAVVALCLLRLTCANAREAAHITSAVLLTIPLLALGCLLLATVAGVTYMLLWSDGDADVGQKTKGVRVLHSVAVGTSRAERIPRAEVAKHNTKQDCWIIVHSLVLDVTHYIPVHPGGESFLTNSAGKDASTSFDTVHDLGDIELYAPEVIIGVAAD